MSKKIAAYMRISVDTEKDRDNTSIENQRRIIKAYIKQTFPDAEVDFYEDRDRSGYTFEQRENYQRMRPLLMNGHYDILMIKDFSRFSRRNSRGLVELEDLRDAGVRIISIGDGIDYPTYDDWNNIQVRFLLNEMPVTDASKKVKRVVESRQNEGNWICAVPYGYYFVNTKEMIFEVDEAAAEVVREIFDLYIKGWGYKKIANYLTEKNIPTPRMVEKERKEAEAAKNKSKEEIKIKASSVWAIPTVSGILQNDFYIGTLRQRKYARKNINGADKKLDVEENKVFENHHPAIVDVKTFMKAQQQLKQRSISHYRGVKKYENEYSGFLFCGDCGSPMFSMSRPDLAAAYTCGTYHKRGLKGCTSHHIRLDTLDDLLKNYVERVMKNSEKMIAELEKAIKDEPQMMKSSASTIAKLEVELAKARESYKATQKQKIRELMKADGDNREIIEETYEEIETELLQKIDGLEKQLEMTVEHRNTRIEVNRIAKTALDIFRDFLEKDKLDKGDLSLIIDKIIVFENKEEGTNKIEIKLKADIQMLLETGTLTEEELEESGYRGKVVNFNWDIESNLSAQIVQKVRNQRDKAFGVNVICEGDPLEIYTDSNGEVIFKKYSPIGEISAFATQFADILAKNTSVPVIVTDRDHCISAAGISKKEVLERRVSSQLEDICEKRKIYAYKKGDRTKVEPLEGCDITASCIAPILCAGDICGAVIFIDNDTNFTPDQSDITLLQVAASFLAKQMEE
ncbi:MAG: stage V sporulation T C-terminal domain-containing protein [Acutalibacteraceae bacterium]|nr:stage V sporulation T C-terminal domain-containing protein [Acutalibacteraceae bacterium]